MHHHTELSFVDEFRWVSHLHCLKKRMTERCSYLVHVASRAANFTLLLRRRVAFLHSTATCRPLFKPSVSLLSTYRQSSCGSNCYRTFKVLIWFSLIWTVLWNYRGKGGTLNECARSHGPQNSVRLSATDISVCCAVTIRSFIAWFSVTCL